MDMIGVEIAKMHKINIIHGDLTTSNMMVRRVREDEENLVPTSDGEGFIGDQIPPAEVVRSFSSPTQHPTHMNISPSNSRGQNSY